MDRNNEDKYLRLVQLMKLYGCEAVRRHFDTVFPPENLKHLLDEQHSFLHRQVNHNCLPATFFQKLFPNEGHPDSKDFDIQLMIYLLRNVPPVHEENYVNVNDINTISNFRNFLEHSSNLIINSNEFEDKWTEVSNAIGNLGGPDLKRKCDILKITNQQLQSEVQKAVGELKNTTTDHERLQKELQRIANEANVSFSESKEIYLDQLLPEENKLLTRLYTLIWRVAPWAVRAKFDKIFPPEEFPQNVIDYYFREEFNYEETIGIKLKLKKFEGRENLTSSDLDLELLTSILTNGKEKSSILMTNINSCEHDALHVLANPKDFLKDEEIKRMTKETLNQHCFVTSEAIICLGGKAYEEICERVLSAEMDQMEESIILGITEIQHQTLRQKMHQQELKDNIQTTYEEVSNPIPRVKRNELKVEIEKWKQENETNVTLQSDKIILSYLKGHSCVTVIGGIAAGKTSILRSVALQMQNIGYQIIPVKTPESIYMFYRKGNKMLFVFDDFCGKSVVDQKQISSWKSWSEKIEMLMEESNCKILMSSKSYLFMDKRVATLSVFQCKFTCVNDMMKFSILEQEFQQMAEKVKLDPIIIHENTDLHNMFPSLIQRIKESKIKTISSHDISTSAYEIYKKELDILFAKDKLKYCALALLVMFDNHLQESHLTSDADEEIKIKIEETYKACNVNIDVPKQSLLNELEVLVDAFTVSFYENFVKVFSAKNETIFNILSKHIGTKLQLCLILFGDASFISQRAILRCAVTSKMSSPLTLIIDDEHKDIYLKRMIRDLNDDYVSDVFLNINLGSPAFRDIFFEIIKRKTITEQTKIMKKKDIFNKTTPLLQSCFFGDIHVIDWMLSLNVDVNLCRDDGTSPLFVACQEGHKDIACRLLGYGANINLCTNDGVTPLDIALENGHKEICSVLVAYKSDRILMILFILLHSIFLLYISAV